MEAVLKHIALEVREADVRSFYCEILGGKVTGQFNMKKEDASTLFNLNQQVDVYFVSLYGVDFELFVHKKTCSNLSHVCLAMNKAGEIFNSSHIRGYRTHLRNAGSTPTYFVKDSNGNMFEIKALNNE